MKNKFILLMAMLCCMGWHSAWAYASVLEGWNMEAGLNVQETYDDNITFTEYEAKSDMTTSIVPMFSFSKPGYSSSTEITASVKQQIFSNYDEFNGLSEYVNVDYALDASKIGAWRIHNYFSQAYEPEEFPDSFGRPQGRIGYYHNSFGAEYRKDRDQQSIVSCGYDFVFDSADKEDLSDASLHTLHVAKEREFSPAVTGAARYACTYRAYSSGNEIWGNRLAVGGTRHLTEHLAATAHAGIDVMRDYEKNNHVKPTFTCSIDDGITERLTVRLSFSQELTTTPFEEDVFDRWEFSGALNHEIFKRWNWVVKTYYGEGTYRIAETTEGIVGADLELYFLMSAASRLSLAYSFTQIESTESGRWYDRNKVSCGLTIRF